MAFNDVVELVINGETVLTCKVYDVSIAFLQVPNVFSITIGSGTTAVELMRRYPAGTPFALKINGVVQFMGFTDGFERQQGDATELTIVGRDALANLVDDEIEHDRSFSNTTFEELTRAAFQSAGYEGISLVYDTAAHRSAVTGTPIVETTTTTETIKSKPVVGKSAGPELVVVSSGEQAGTPFATDVVTLRTGTTTVETTVQKTVNRITGFKCEKPIQWKAGSGSHYAALNKELMRGGLFLRAGVDPEGKDPNVFLLGQPSASQAPLFGLVRSFGEKVADNVVSVLPPRINGVTTGRHAKYIVQGRSGGGKDGQQPIEGVFVDEEMTTLGYTKRRVVKDENAKTRAQALFLARKLCAEARRTNRTFVYTVPGMHSLPLLRDPSQRAIPTADVCVTLQDDEHGLKGIFWIERVRFRATASGGTFTDLTLMVPDDLVFGDSELFPAASKKGRTILGKQIK